MNFRILPLLALVAFAAVPVVMGSAESNKSEKSNEKPVEKDKTSGDLTEAAPPRKKLSSECLASEEVIADLEAREKLLKQREEKLKEQEKEVSAQSSSVKEEMGKLEQKRVELQGAHQKQIAAREEQVNKLIETFEGMSPKSAALVIAAVDDELAVLALGKLTSVKSGKILGNLKPEKSAHLSELMVYGKTKSSGKETAHGESDDRSPASSNKR